MLRLVFERSNHRLACFAFLKPHQKNVYCRHGVEEHSCATQLHTLSSNIVIVTAKFRARSLIECIVIDGYHGSSMNRCRAEELTVDPPHAEFQRVSLKESLLFFWCFFPPSKHGLPHPDICCFTPLLQLGVPLHVGQNFHIGLGGSGDHPTLCEQIIDCSCIFISL